VALFGRKKPGDGPGSGDGKEVPPFQPNPEDARQWFDRARAMADRFSYDSALFYYANGIRLDPTPMSAHEAMFQSALKYAKANGAAATRDELKKLDGPHPVEKFAAAEFAWLKDLNNAALALRFLECSVKAGRWGAEPGRFHCPRVLNVLRGQKKPSKSTYLAAKDLFPALGAWNEAIAAGQEALRLDPRDTALENELTNLAAQRTMDEGRYAEAGGTEGGFLKFVKDIDKQRELEEKTAISGGLDVERRNLDRARREYEARPDVPDLINQFGQLLKATGTAEAQEEAFQVFTRGHQATGQYRFRAAAGDVRIEQAQARSIQARERAAQSPGDAALQQAAEAARRACLDLQHAEYTDRVREYPTDRRLKHRLGEVAFELGRFDEAMQRFQEAKDDPKLRVRAGHMLGRSFASDGFHDMAIQEFKESLERIEAGDRETELAIRYDLMVSLMEEARRERSLDHARQALEIASSIARKDITYRDIRNRRKQADELIRELGGGPPA
jgi:tetratricopeptide (TPR) repeat protein